MKINNFLPAMLLLLTLSGCDVIATIFEAGVWSGIFIVIIVVALIIWLIGRARK